MGNLVSIDRVGQNKAHKALKSACARPNCIFWVDHVNVDLGGGWLCRHAIYQNKEGWFEVVQRKILVKDINQKVYEEKKSSFSLIHQAKEAIEQSVTLMELEGWDYMDEKELPLYDVLSDADEKLAACSYIRDINCVHAWDVLGEGVVYGQKIPAGFRMFVAIDAFGAVWVRAFSLSGNGGWELASSAIRNKLGNAANIDEARGMVIEIVMQGAKITVMDVWYLHDKWLVGLSREERHALIHAYDVKHKMALPMVTGVKVRPSGAAGLILRDVKGILVERNGHRYMINRKGWEMYIANTWHKNLNIQDGITMEKVGQVDGTYLPDLTYMSFKAAGEGTDALWY